MTEKEAGKNLQLVGETVPDPAQEGHRKRLVKRIVRFPLPEPYEDFSVQAWVNYPASLLNSAKTEDERIAALRQIVLEHDLVDFEGEPYPPADTKEFWINVPQDVGAFIMVGIQQQQGRLDPKTAAR